ncbi:MAG TPA: hypothetical protein ENN46_02125 [Candidatus Woesearchaeota archaeon]|nr:hypothetical protein [Candidatus Woesearchaeota archaeon]
MKLKTNPFSIRVITLFCLFFLFLYAKAAYGETPLCVPSESCCIDRDCKIQVDCENNKICSGSLFGLANCIDFKCDSPSNIEIIDGKCVPSKSCRLNSFIEIDCENNKICNRLIGICIEFKCSTHCDYVSCARYEICIKGNCVPKPTDPVMLGFITLDSISINEHSAKYSIELTEPNEMPRNAKSSHFCGIWDNTFNAGGCQKWPYNDCNLFDAKFRDHVFFRQVDKDNKDFEVLCNKMAIRPWVAFCDGVSNALLKFSLCDTGSGIPCESKINLNPSDKFTYLGLTKDYDTVNINLADSKSSVEGKFSYECVTIGDMIVPGSSNRMLCKDEQGIALYAVNHLHDCGQQGGVCVNGVCKEHICIPDDALHKNEECDPEAGLFWVTDSSGNRKQVSRADISCMDYGLVPKDGNPETKPECDDYCIIDLSSCVSEAHFRSQMCGNHQIDIMPLSKTQEACDMHESGTFYEHPFGDTREKTILLPDSQKLYCGQQAGFIGDAELLRCLDECSEVSFEWCMEDLSLKNPEAKGESDCADGYNDNYWHVISNIDESIANDGYFDISRVRYNEELCLSPTQCTDCHDISCHMRDGNGGICNFMEELYCNDGFDNNGNGLVDLEDPSCSPDPRYNPDQSKIGFCNVNYNCYLDRDSLSGKTKELCYKDGEIVWDMEGDFICAEDNFWTSPLKAMAGLFYSVSDKNEFSIYCNDYGDREEGYVVAYNSKTPSGMNTGDFMRLAGSSFRKMCAFSSGDYWGVSAKIRDVNQENSQNIARNIQSAMPLFSSNRAACDSTAENKESLLVQSCNDFGVFMNSRYGIIFRTNRNIENAPVLTGLDYIKSAIEELDPIGSETPHLSQGAKTEAFVWKRNGDKEIKEIIGAIEQINGTVYAMIIYKNIDNFDEICKDSLSMIRISSRVYGECFVVGSRDYLVKWSFQYDAAELQASKSKFNELVRNVKIN